MQTSTSSLSRSSCLGSNESSTSASLRHDVVENALVLLTRVLDLGLSNKQRRRAGANCERAAVANLGVLFGCEIARLARGIERVFGGISGAALGFRRSGCGMWDVWRWALCHPPMRVRTINRAPTSHRPIGVIPDASFQCHHRIRSSPSRHTI